MTAPFLKWAGGKRALVPALTGLMPASYGDYYEPFVGGGAVFFALRPRRAFLNDANEELVNCYAVVRDRLDDLLTALAGHRNTEEHFRHVRAQSPEQLDDVARAARFVYLNRTCFNGLYRVNRRGEFNTPYGHYANPTLVPEALLRAASAALQGVTLTATRYLDACATAAEGDLVYLDPPYVPVGEFADFRRYHRDQFREDDHEELARLFKDLDARGCHVRLSNSYTPWVLDLYADWNVHVVTTRRAINSNGSGRGPVREVIVAND
ncbi:MAG: adenine methylase [Frankiaceae bacterium]|nr:adenine methylase [Frankiaceae bacterium]